MTGSPGDEQARATVQSPDQETAMSNLRMSHPRMSNLRSFLLALGAATLAAAPAAADRVPLAQQSVITEGLIATAIAYEIGERCDSIDARILRGLTFLGSLRSEARRMGYSNAEIESFMNDRSEKTRLEAAAWQRFAELGGRRDDSASFCAVGQAQMAAGSQIGRLLR